MSENFLPVNSAPTAKLNELEGLRGVAAFVVLLHHLRLTFAPDAFERLSSRLGITMAIFIESLFDGNFAVWLFWVMSAFVLSIKFYKSNDIVIANKYLTDAALRRYPRLLLPVLVSVIVAWLLHALGLMSNRALAAQFGPKFDWLASCYEFEPNFLDAIKSATWSVFFRYDWQHSYNSVLWTMEVELLGSYFLFALLALLGHHPCRIFLYFPVALVLYRLNQHFNAFLFGAVLCDVYVQGLQLRKSVHKEYFELLSYTSRSRLLAVVLVAPILYAIGLPNLHGCLHLFLATFLTAFVLVSSPAKWLFSHSLFAFLGKISFGLYLAHMPLICVFAYPLYNALSSQLPPTASAIFTSFTICILSLLSGWLLWFVADRPSIALSHQVSNLVKRMSAHG